MKSLEAIIEDNVGYNVGTLLVVSGIFYKLYDLVLVVIEERFQVERFQVVLCDTKRQESKNLYSEVDITLKSVCSSQISKNEDNTSLQWFSKGLLEIPFVFSDSVTEGPTNIRSMERLEGRLQVFSRKEVD